MYSCSALETTSCACTTSTVSATPEAKRSLACCSSSCASARRLCATRTCAAGAEIIILRTAVLEPRVRLLDISPGLPPCPDGKTQLPLDGKCSVGGGGI